MIPQACDYEPQGSLSLIQRNWVPYAYERQLADAGKFKLISFLSVLMRHASEEDLVDVRQSKLALVVGASERTIRRWEKELVALGILEDAGFAGRTRVLRILPAEPVAVQKYRRKAPVAAKTVKARPQQSPAGSVAHAGEGGLLPFESNEAERPRSEREKGSAGRRVRRSGPPSQPLSPGEQLFSEVVEDHLGKDPETLERIRWLCEKFGCRAVEAWARTQVQEVLEQHTSKRGPAALLRNRLMNAPVELRFQRIGFLTPERSADQDWAPRRKEREAELPGSADCDHCNGSGHLARKKGDPIPDGARFSLHNRFSGYDYYTCPCVASRRAGEAGSPQPRQEE